MLENPLNTSYTFNKILRMFLLDSKEVYVILYFERR
nr:MAG TPA: hypothetical protein [Caudoviricetes sp.]